MRYLLKLFNRLGICLFLLAGLFAIFTVTAVLVLRFVNPQETAFMVQARTQLAAREQREITLRHAWVDYEHIAAPMRLAVVTAEDQKFSLHMGFDWGAVTEAWRHNQESAHIRGASTISQQVAKNMFLWSDRSWIRKGLEAWFTLLIEALWPKQRILEVYLNVAQFGDAVFGVEAAAQHFFRKPAVELTRAEAALLAAALPAPTRYRVGAPSPYLRERQFWILWQMRLLGRDYLAGLD